MSVINRESLLSKFESGALLFQPDVRKIIESEPIIEAIPISFIENRITELAKERHKHEIGTPEFRYADMQIYYYEMLLEDWKPTLTEW